MKSCTIQWRPYIDPRQHMILSRSMIAAAAKVTFALLLMFTGEKSSTVASPILDKTTVTSNKTECFTIPFSLDVQEPGCYSLKVKNNACYGACESVYVPKAGSEKSIQRCTVCQPKRMTEETFTLICNENGKITQKLKKIRVVYSCHCKLEKCRRRKKQ